MLTLLVAITLKINDELSAATGRGYLENFVDWPYYDQSVFELAKNLIAKSMKLSMMLSQNSSNDGSSEPA